MAKEKAAKRATKTYSVIVKTAEEDMPVIDALMGTFEKRFKQELGEHGTVTVMEEKTVKEWLQQK